MVNNVLLEFLPQFHLYFQDIDSQQEPSEMTQFFRAFGFFALLTFISAPAWADDNGIPERVLGKADAPITVEEYVSLTCSHCATFYNDILPELEKRYVNSGKVKFILRDFPLDGTALKAAAVARCMPEDEFYPFVKILYKNQANWAFNGQADTVLIQYAKLGGLNQDRAKACMTDTKTQDALIAGRTASAEKQHIEATPTFIINNGVEVLKGAQPVDVFAKVFDRLLADKH